MGALRRNLEERAGEYRAGLVELTVGAWHTYLRVSGEDRSPVFMSLPEHERAAWVAAVQFVAETMHDHLTGLDSPANVPTTELDGASSEEPT